MDVNLDSIGNTATIKLITNLVAGLYSQISQKTGIKIKEHDFEQKSKILHEKT